MKPIWWWAVPMVVLPVMAQAAIHITPVKSAGVTAWLVEDAHIPAFHLTMTFTQAGSASDPKDKQGLANLAASMLMEGTNKRDDEAFHQALESRAISMDVSVSADALTIEMESLSEHEEEAFGLLREMLQQPRLAEASLTQVKERVAGQIRRLAESPDAVASQQWMKLAYGDHPYAQQRLGTPDSLSAITVADIGEFLQGQLAKDQVVVAAVGDIDAEKLKHRLHGLLAKLPDSQARPIAIAPIELKQSGSWQDVTMEVPQTIIHFGTQGVKRTDPRFYQAYVMNQIVGGATMTSRLGSEVREKRGLTYGINTGLSTLSQSDLWVGAFATRADQAGTAMKVVQETLGTMAEKGVTQTEFDQAMGYILGSFPLMLDSNAGIANYLIAMQVNHLGIDYFDKRDDYFHQVTLSQVNAMAKQMLDPNHLIVVKVGPKGQASDKKVP